MLITSLQFTHQRIRTYMYTYHSRTYNTCTITYTCTHGLTQSHRHSTHTVLYTIHTPDVHVDVHTRSWLRIRSILPYIVLRFAVSTLAKEQPGKKHMAKHVNTTIHVAGNFRWVQFLWMVDLDVCLHSHNFLGNQYILWMCALTPIMCYTVEFISQL